MKKGKAITIFVILAVIIFLYFQFSKPSPSPVSEELAKCIGENSILFTQTGCVHCENQYKLFGSSKKFLNMVDCVYEKAKCSEIKGTPTWVINETQYVGVQQVDRLKELTGCYI